MRLRSLFEPAQGPVGSGEPALTQREAKVLAERVMGFVTAPDAVITVESASTGSTM